MWWPLVKNMLAKGTVYQKERHMHNEICPQLGNLPITEIKESVLVDFYDRLRARGLAPSSIRGRQNIISPSLQWAVERGYIPYNPARLLRLPHKARTITEPYTKDEILRMLAAARTMPGYETMHDLILLAVRTGLRRGELYGLWRNAIDLPRNCLYVRRALSSPTYGQVEIIPPKTAQSRRRVDLDADSVAMLQRRCATLHSRWVFEDLSRTQYGCMPVPWHTHTQLAAVCKQAGVEYKTFRALRHTHATDQLRMGVHPKTVAERLGHTSVATTLDIYSHALPTMQSTAVQASDLYWSTDYNDTKLIG